MFLIIRFLLVTLLIVFFTRMVKRFLRAPQSYRTEELDPYEVLGIEKNASSEAIKQAYKNALKEYHPDKVSHLGAELQKLAKIKTEQIITAYKYLS